jgi:energy-converting hydrogenase Eha subunit F
MPKRMFLIALAVASMALAACGAAYDPNDLYGTPAPTASPTPVTTPNSSVTTAIVDVTVSSSPLPNEVVSLYSDVNGHAGSVLQTQTTSTAGVATFAGLTGAANYCFEASYTPPGGLMQNQSICTNLWGFGVDIAF